MTRNFQNRSLLSNTYEHHSLPVLKTSEFSFYRSVFLEDWVYNKTVSELHKGNLRENDNKGRHSKLFPKQKISYWASNPETAFKEIKKHGSGDDYIQFEAYDDPSSTFPTITDSSQLTIVNGDEIGFAEILDRIEKDIDLDSKEVDTIEQITHEKPDCLAYTSIEDPKGTNFLFFERGFRKLSIKNVKLFFDSESPRFSNVIHCSTSSDYVPEPQAYGYYFESRTEVKEDKKYTETDEYKLRSSQCKFI